jgi:serine/threonine protein kinase
MGEVYLAEDTELDRKVALKFLPSHLCQDEDCRKRFKREAQAAAKLSHPNIIHVYEVSDYHGRPFFAMEHVEGQSLREFASGKNLSIDQILMLGIQICEGLDDAHQKGVTHRDIKPSNILIDSNGRVKTVDFGLASVAGSDQLTKTGSTLGTIGYMSPEQVEGREVNHRSDLFSLGVVLYELITSNNPFKRDNSAATLKAVSDDIPHPIARYRSGTPDGLQGIIDKALEKDAKRRYQHADDMQVDLRRLRADSDSDLLMGTRPRKTSWKPVRSWAVGIVLLVLAVAIAVVTLESVYEDKGPPSQATHSQITFTGKIGTVDISPDGKSVAYTSRESESVDNPSQTLYVRDIAGGRPIAVFSAEYFTFCRWSSDGSELVFAEVTDSIKSGVHIVPRLGGSSRDLPFHSIGCLSPDGNRLACTGSNWKRVHLIERISGDTAAISLAGTFNWVFGIDWSPLGHQLLFLTNDNKGLSSIWIINTDGTGQTQVIQDSVEIRCPRWSPEGDAIYFLRDRGQTKDLMKVGISRSTGEVTTSPKIVQSGLQCGNISISEDAHRLAFTRVQSSSNLWTARLGQGGLLSGVNTRQLTEGTSSVFAPSISPDGRNIVFSMGNTDEANIYTVSIEGDNLRQVTFFDGFNDVPVWSPDGKEIAFCSRQSGAPRIWRMKKPGDPLTAFANSEPAFAGRAFVSWSSCGEILYLRPGDPNYVVLDPDTGDERPLVATDSIGRVFYPRCSPDGQKVAVVYNPRDGRTRINSMWVLSMEDSTRTNLNTKYLQPIGWSSDDGRIYACEIAVGKGPHLGFAPVIYAVSPEGGEHEPIATLPFDKLYEKVSISSDGKTLAFVIAESQSDIWLVENFDPNVN